MANAPARLEEFRAELVKVIKTAAGRKVVHQEIGRLYSAMVLTKVPPEQRVARAKKAINARWERVRAARQQQEERVA